VLEYVNRLHEHFTDPVRVTNGRYLAKEMPGFSATLRAESLRDFRFPDGAAWRQADGELSLIPASASAAAKSARAGAHGLTHLTGTKTDGARVDLWFRSTVGLRRTGGEWQITHEHDSTPFYMDGSDRAATDLKP
jgi:hypothetical protein